MDSMRIAVLITVHNRVAITVRGLSKLASLADRLAPDFEFDVFLVDDGCTDGTSGRVLELPLNTTIITGSGSLYWNRGMSLAYQTARSSNKTFNAYMMYNDDILLNDKFEGFVRTFRDLGNCILVGAFLEPETGQVSYSGFLQSRGRLRPLDLAMPELDNPLVRVDTFNGNLVLMPADAFEALNGLDPGYTHAYGDVDLGLRAAQLGIQSYVYGDPVGFCARGSSLFDRARAADLKGRWKLLFGYPHGLGSYLRFTRRHGLPAMYPVYAVREATRRVAVLFGRRVSGE